MGSKLRNRECTLRTERMHRTALGARMRFPSDHSSGHERLRASHSGIRLNFSPASRSHAAPHSRIRSTVSRIPVRRTKIVATLGPAWDTRERMGALIDAGVDVVRINASHGTAEARVRWIEDLKAVRAEPSRADRAVAILVDLQEPRIRVGRLPVPLLPDACAVAVFAPAVTV